MFGQILSEAGARATGVVLDTPTVERIMEQGNRVLAPYRKADGTIRFASPGLIAVATR